MEHTEGYDKVTMQDIREYQQRVKDLKNSRTFTASNYKALGRELRDKYGLTDMEALDILNGGI